MSGSAPSAGRRRDTASSPLGAIDAPRIVELSLIEDERGKLGVVEAAAHAGFPFQRFYFLSDVPVDVMRGAHAHKRLRQCIVCLRGGVTVLLTKRGQKLRFRLDDVRNGLVLPPGYWRDLSEFSEDALVGVLASEAFEEEDYIRDFADFETWENEALQPQRVPYADLNRCHEALSGEIEFAMRRVFRSGRYIGGEEVTAFERAFADYSQVEGAVGMANGLQALVLALKAWNIGPGDEVVLPANTFIATALAVNEVGATPVLADIEPDTGSIDITAVEAAITPRTRAVIPVHLYGHPADIDAIRSALAGRDVRILEDAAQAHGALYKGRRCGSLGDAAAFSFYPTKNLGALGDAGAVTAQDPALLERVRMLANYGARVKYHHELAGTNSRLDPLQAAVLSVKLPHLEHWNNRRRALAQRYLSGLKEIDGLELPAVREWAVPVWHVFPVRVPAKVRDRLAAVLEAAGIGTNIHYPIPVSRQECLREMGWKAGQFPRAEETAEQLLSLPLDPFHTDSEIDKVIGVTRRFFAPGT